MTIDKSKLKIGLWFTDDEGNIIPWNNEVHPEGATYAHSCFPLEIREHCYKIRKDGGYGTKDEVYSAISKSVADMASGKYGIIVRSKGIISDLEGKWHTFNLTPEEVSIEDAKAIPTGKIVVIGSKIDKEEIKKLF